MLEFTAAAFTFFTVLFGVIEFSYVFYQYNAATKAVEYGARLAAVSEPVVAGLRDVDGLSATVLPGDPMPAFDYVCVEGATGCDDDALRLLVFGRCDPAQETCADGTINGETIPIREACSTTASPGNVGMCNIFPSIDDIDKIQVRYQYTGLGYAGRPGGPVPTITVGLVNLTYSFVLIGGFLPVSSITMPSFATTVTGEDLNVMWNG